MESDDGPLKRVFYIIFPHDCLVAWGKQFFCEVIIIV
jgi:hypothetical protein